MDKIRHFLPVRIIRNGYHESGSPSWKILFLIVGLAVLQTVLVIAGSTIDNTLKLPGIGVGFLEHYGVWAILLCDPLLLISTSYAYRRFRITIDALPYSEEFLKKYEYQNSTRAYLKFLHMEENGKYLYLLLVIIGLLCWVNNIRQTIDPLETYGNDVFDSFKYFWGFIANKLNLFSSWVFVYPLVAFFLVSMGVSTRQILKKLVSKSALKPSVLHPDGCYGLSSLGFLNIALLLPYLLAYFTIFMLLLTHEDRYASIIFPLIFLTVVTLVVSFITIGPISGIGKKADNDTYKNILKQSKKIDTGDANIDEKFSLERTCYTSASATPYSSSTNKIINLMRSIPVALTAVKLLS